MPDNSLLPFKRGWPRSWFKKQEILGPIVGELQDVVEDLKAGTALAAGSVGTTAIAAGAVTGAKASATLRSKHSNGGFPAAIPTAAGTSEIIVIAAAAGTVSAVRFSCKDGLIASDSNWVQFKIINKGQVGTGTTDILDTGAVNTNKVTGGTALTGYASRSLTLHATPANLVIAAGDVLAVQVIGTGTLPNTLTEAAVKVVFDQLA